MTLRSVSECGERHFNDLSEQTFDAVRTTGPVIFQHPTVVLDENCHALQGLVSAFAPTYLFKRKAGFLSDPGAATDELHEALMAGLFAGPCILVSPSFGAFTALLFGQRFPGCVAGLILVDPSHPRQGQAVFETLSSTKVPQLSAIAKFRTELAGFGPVWEEGSRLVISELSTLGNIPLIVLAAGRLEVPNELGPAIIKKLMHDRHSLLGEYAKRSNRGELRIIPNVGHNIAADSPEVVRDAIYELLTRVATEQTRK